MNQETHPQHPYVPAEEQRASTRRRHPVVICGAGPVGLTTAVGLARQGIPVVLLEKDHTYSIGSRAICWAERTLDIWNRLGCVQPILERSVTWSIGRVYYQAQEVYNFDLKPSADHKHPPFRNLQQYEVEAILYRASQESGKVDVRWGHQITGVRQESEGVVLSVQTPGGTYELEARYVVAADGAQSGVRQSMGLEFEGAVFESPFLIADIRMKADFPSERFFWFDPSFHPGRSALLHKQANNLWRIDLQLEPGADPDEERRPERVAPRIRAMVGEDTAFDVVWSSVYTFKCRRLASFWHGRVFFAGDAAHQLSPFGARGGNCAVQDADNLVWKLGLVLKGLASDSIFASYNEERIFGSDFDIMTAMRSNHFIAPQTRVRQAFRDAVLALSQKWSFVRPLVNSGRMSNPVPLLSSSLNTPDTDEFTQAMRPGMPSPNIGLDATQGGSSRWLHDELGKGFSALYFAQSVGDIPAKELEALAELANAPIPIQTRVVVAGSETRGVKLPSGVTPLVDTQGILARLCDARPGTFYLIRPDCYVVARWRQFDAQRVRRALDRATGGKVGDAQAKVETNHG
ncbi:FAD-dependent oxidoreductase [Archangium sp.]|uniref:FAD-dependent oxidoreductase n=1 Tax=Archangium sp. TaxID=1872627 RepID=UPI002D3DF9F5|nr:FAD-dependent oxidoreductase [Archangium sp.]HYO51305.1 FAD-dependent oxidoreductase [Archangium sp.]